MESNSELTHWGIKGMRWGVRRYQNKDGSLTSLGKKRRRSEYDNENKKEETVEEKRKRILNSSDAKEIYENRHLLNTNELNDRINRIDMEARLASKIPSETEKRGIDFVNDKMKSTTDTLNNAVNMYRKVDEAYSTVSNSAIGKTLAKKLGLEVEPKKKEFDLDDFWKNRNKKSNSEIGEVSKRLINEGIIEKEVNRRKGNSG